MLKLYCIHKIRTYYTKEEVTKLLNAIDYFARSVGFVTQDIIKEYIENQQDEYEENFKIPG